MTNNKSNFLPIAVMFALFFMIAFVTNFAGSMGVIVKNQFHAGGVGYVGSYIVPLIGLCYIFFYAQWGSKNVNKDIPTD